MWIYNDIHTVTYVYHSSNWNMSMFSADVKNSLIYFAADADLGQTEPFRTDPSSLLTGKRWKGSPGGGRTFGKVVTACNNCVTLTII